MLFGLIILLFVFILGLSVGSFINVLESRLYSGENVFVGRSKCDHCGKKLHWFDMVPVFSWIFYGGWSRCCRKKLSVQYPLVEFATGISFVLLFMLAQNYSLQMKNYMQNSLIGSLNFFVPIFLKDLGWIIYFVFYCFIFIMGFTIFLQDLKYQAIHGGLLWFLIIVTFLLNLFLFIFGKNFQFSISNFQNNFLYQIQNTTYKINLFPAFLSSLPFYLIYKLSHEKWLGEGDVWIAFWMGLFLGFPNAFWAIYFGFILGGVFSIFILLLHLKKMRDTISLGPFLLIGVLISLICFR